MGEIDGAFRAWGFCKNGNGGVTAAIASSARALGVEIRTNAAVQQVIVKGGRAAGVALANGDELRAKVVISAADPKRSFLQFVEGKHLPDDFVQQIQNFRVRGSSGKVNIALSELPDFTCLPGEGPLHRGAISISPSMEYIERAYDEAKYGQFAKHPYIDMIFPSMIDRDMAPPGHHVMSCFVQYAPYDIEGGWDDAKRDAFGETVISTIERYAPNIRSAIVGKQVITPKDIETHRRHHRRQHLPRRTAAAPVVLPAARAAMGRFPHAAAGLLLRRVRRAPGRRRDGRGRQDGGAGSPEGLEVSHGRKQQVRRHHRRRRPQRPGRRELSRQGRQEGAGAGAARAAPADNWRRILRRPAPSIRCMPARSCGPTSCATSSWRRFGLPTRARPLPATSRCCPMAAACSCRRSPAMPQTLESIRQFSAADAARWPEFVAFMDRAAAFLDAAYRTPMPRLPNVGFAEGWPLAKLAWTLRRLGGKDMFRVIRAMSMSAVEFTEEWFESEELKAAIAAVAIHGHTLGFDVGRHRLHADAQLAQPRRPGASAGRGRQRPHRRSAARPR